MSVAAAVFTAATFLSVSGNHECHNVLAIDFFFQYIALFYYIKGFLKRLKQFQKHEKIFIIALMRVCCRLRQCTGKEIQLSGGGGARVLFRP